MGRISESILGSDRPRLRSKDLPTIWTQARMQPTPKEFSPIQASQDFPAYWLKPEDMARTLDASRGPYYGAPTSGQALYLNKAPTFTEMDYPTSAVETPHGTIFSSESPKRGFLNFSKPDPSKYSDIPSDKRHLIANAIYQHEKAHFLDPRLKPGSYNKGYGEFFGLPGNIGVREAPAMLTEDLYWDAIRSGVQNPVIPPPHVLLNDLFRGRRQREGGAFSPGVGI